MMKGIAEKLAEENNQPMEWGWKQFTDQIALKRLSKPEDVANVVSFLAVAIQIILLAKQSSLTVV